MDWQIALALVLIMSVVWGFLAGQWFGRRESKCGDVGKSYEIVRAARELLEEIEGKLEGEK